MAIFRIATSKLGLVNSGLFNHVTKKQHQTNKLLRKCMLSTAARQDGNDTDTDMAGFIPLPTDRSRDNIQGTGWKVATTVKQSGIPGAGFGRYSNVDVPKNTIVMAKTIVPMTEVSSIHSIANDETILFKNEDEIEKFISLYESEGQQTREDTIECLSHFMFTYPNLDGVAFHWTSSSVNHGDSASIVTKYEDGMMVAETLTDVKAGEEFFINYRNYVPMKKFWVDFCNKSGEKDVVTTLKQFVEF